MWKKILITTLFVSVSIAGAGDYNATKKFSPYTGNKQIIIMLDTQKLVAVQNGKPFLSSPISTGRWGHETSVGDYQVLFKEKDHVSNAYPVKEGGKRGGAKMPYTVRFTSSGEAIHAGYLPGYPDSHGCVRMPLSKAKKLYKWADIGVPVRVIGKTRYTDRVNRMRITMGEGRGVQRHKGRKRDITYVSDDFMAGVFND